ncbi:MAG: hypothetical protein HY540_06080 [Deltaproteobacteria bacterium]|nr:hypothetical protein [Deltaproteobacteria bacterium]
MSEIRFQKAAAQPTSAEIKAYKDMKEMEENRSNRTIDIGIIPHVGVDVDLMNEGKKAYVGCSSIKHLAGKTYFRCGTQEGPFVNHLFAQKIREVRYGDIDKDGDIDIAVKLEDGAIFVFHNPLI